MTGKFYKHDIFFSYLIANHKVQFFPKNNLKKFKKFRNKGILAKNMRLRIKEFLLVLLTVRGKIEGEEKKKA